MGMYENPPYYLSTYALAVKRGFKGTEDEWLKSLQGPEGKPGGDAYQVAVSQGFEGTVVQWLESLRGPKGPQGPQGECDAFYVLITQDGATKTADKTFAEIMTAYEAARPIYGLITQTDVLNLVHVDPDAFVFQGIVGAVYQRVIIRSNNTVAYTSEKYVVIGDLLSPLYVVLRAENGAYAIDSTFDDIRTAYDQQRSVYCMAGTMRLSLAGISADTAMFSAANKSNIFRVIVKADGTVEHQSYKCALEEDLRPAATDEIYFDITADGVLSLKPEYRGASPSDTANYTYALSDNGKGRDGTQNKELPEEIVIPETVRGIPVTAYAYAMFINNKRVKRLVLLPGVKELPSYFCYGTWNLEAVTGTENVETLDKYAFATSGIRAANFPALQTFSGAYQFRRCTNLAVVDLGGVVTEIPARCFEGCEKLYEIRNGQSIRKIGECGLYFTLRLKQLPFLSSVTEISDCGLLVSRVDVGQVSPDCQVGTWATAKAFYGEDYWTEPGKNATPCNTPLRSIFHQDDPRWVDKTIGNTGRTWDKGCMPICAAMAYSIFEDKDLASPEEFTNAVYAADPSLKEADPAEWGNIERYFEAVGYTATKYTPFNAANLQVMYDALATGAVVIHRCFAGAIKSAEGWLDDNHLVLIHGINAEGEVLCVDPAAPNEALGVYEGITYAMPIQNRTRAAEGTEKDCFWIVRKNFPTDESYFNVTDSGVLSLKPEYRGEVPAAAASNAKYADAVSDRGAALAGTQNHELPEEIVIPETVGGIVVTAYCYAMFMSNKRIKRLTVPATIKEIPGYFCYGTWNLRSVTGTESVEVLCTHAFQNSGILAARFPGLKRLDGKNQFQSCVDMVTADLGNTITAIPEGCLYGCERLKVLQNTGSITTVGINGFRDTRHLKTLSFLPNITSIGDYGFFNSRVAYNWDSLTNCTFGTLATPADLYDADYWSGCTFTPCSVPLRSTFSQLDPRWTDKTVGNTSATYSCAVISMAMAYSALMGMDLSSPEEFIDMVFAVDPSLKDLNPEQEAEVAVVKYMTAAGFDTTWHPATEDNFLQTAYDGLAAGAVLIQHCMSTNAGSGHARFVYGVNAAGEMLFADPTAISVNLGRYEAGLHPQPPQNRMGVPQLDGHPMDGFWIVKKKEV